MMTNKPIEQVLKENTEHLMELPGVQGTAQGLCGKKPCIQVYVSALTPELKEAIPPSLEGYKVDIIVSGQIEALPNN